MELFGSTYDTYSLNQYLIYHVHGLLIRHEKSVAIRSLTASNLITKTLSNQFNARR